MPAQSPLEPLFDEFPPTSTDAWEAKIEEDLKGKNRSDVLVWEALDGVTLQPYYRREDLQRIDHVDESAAVPPLAGGDDLAAQSWTVRQDVTHPDLEEAARLARRGLERGGDALGVVAARPGGDGDRTPLASREAVDRFLDALPSPLPPLHFSSGPAAVALFALFDAAVRERTAADAIRGSIEFDPVEALANGRMHEPGRAFDLGASLVRDDAHPEVRTWSVRSTPYHDAGASLVQEVAATLGALSESLAQFTDRGVSLGEAVGSMQVVTPVSTGYFLEIAKLRALRLLIPQVVRAFADAAGASLSFSPDDLVLQAGTSGRSHTRYDPYVNMLRGTTEAMAAVIGGCDVLRVRRHDARLRAAEDFSERIARNTQLILRDEAHADHVADPSAGSYYIEAATDRVAENAWSQFQDLEARGGLLEALRHGSLQEAIARVRDERTERVATRQQVLVGTNHYPNLSERRPDVRTDDGTRPGDGARPDATDEGAGRPSRSEAGSGASATDFTEARLSRLREAVRGGARRSELVDALTQTASEEAGDADERSESGGISSLPVVRLSDPFDDLRLRTAAHADATGAPPTIFLAPLGHPAMRSARANFARNFFGVAGFEIIENLRFDHPAAAAGAAVDEDADVVVLCSSDREVPDLAPALRSALEDAEHEALLVVAGNPETIEGDVDADGFIHLGSPLLDTLRAYQDRLLASGG